MIGQLSKKVCENQNKYLLPWIVLVLGAEQIWQCAMSRERHRAPAVAAKKRLLPLTPPPDDTPSAAPLQGGQQPKIDQQSSELLKFAYFPKT